MWVRWRIAEGWSVALRPEVFSDPKGQITGARRFLEAYTETVEYRFSRRSHRFGGIFEARYDRSTGDEGGFYDKPDNLLVPSQSLACFGLSWSFDR